MLPVAGGVLASLMLASRLRARQRPQPSVYGSARWATAREIRRAGLLRGEGVLVGKLGRQYVRVGGEAGVLVVGPPGFGKSAMCFIPTLLSTPYSVLVLDLTGDLIAATATYRERLGPVYVFDPSDWHSTRLNPLDLVRWHTADETTDVQRAAMHIAQGEQYGKGQRPISDEGQFYRRWARFALWTAMLYLKHDSRGLPPCTLAGLLQFFSQSGPGLHAALTAMQACPHPKVRQGAGLLLGRPARDQAEVFSAAAGYLMAWADDKLAHVTSETTIPLDDLQGGERPVSVYLRINVDDARDRLRPFLRLLIEQTLLRVSMRASTAYQHRVLAVLDDVAELGYLPVLESAAAFYRKYGWRLLLACQSFNQLWDAYGQRTSLLNTLTTWVIFRQIDPDSAAYVSQKLGETTLIEQSARVTRRGGWGRPSVSRGVQYIRRPLLTPGEVMSLGVMDAAQGSTGEVIVSTARLASPARLSQFAWFNEPAWRGRVS